MDLDGWREYSPFGQRLSQRVAHVIVEAFLQGFGHDVLTAHFQVGIVEGIEKLRANVDRDDPSTVAHALTEPASDGTGSRAYFRTPSSLPHTEGLQMADRGRVGQRRYAFQPLLLTLPEWIQDVLRHLHLHFKNASFPRFT